MSPDAPGRIAYTGRGESPGYPELKYNRPCFEKGEGAVRIVIPPISQSSLPSRSYERTLPLADTTNSVRWSFSQTNGVDQVAAFLFSSRLTLQISFPVRLSNAAMNESVRLSWTM